MCRSRIVVRIEISTLSNSDGKLNHRKMDRLAMVLSNLNNGGKQVIVVSSGAIALGTDKLGLKEQPKSYMDMQAIAAIGQAELIRFYQHYFDQYNQIVAQVLLTADIMDSPERVKNTQNTFNTLLDRNIIPVVNENDAVSLTDIQLEDNYRLALQVAKITEADIILIKMDTNSKYIIQPRGNLAAKMVADEDELFNELEKTCTELHGIKEEALLFPNSIDEIIVNRS
ncbi:MAG: glutamate 5-kinase [Bacteroidales bacterium]|nr:glutamate 5-kinase [Bacteroidales bacterium]